MEKQSNIWWHTVLLVFAALAMIVPCVLLAGVAVWIADFIQEGYIGKTGEGIGFIMRGIQFFAATYACLAIPYLVLKRSNIVVASTIVGTIFVLINLGLTYTGWYTGALGVDYFKWAEMIAIVIGTGIGAGFFAVEGNR